VTPRGLLAASAILGIGLGVGGCIFDEDCPYALPVVTDPSTSLDADRDGVPGSGPAPLLDCNDADRATHPGALDVPDDGIDQDCDGVDATLLDAAAACGRARPALFGDNLGDTSAALASMPSSCGAGAHAVVFELAPTGEADRNLLTLSVSSATPHAVHVRSLCTDATTELGCTSEVGAALEVELDVSEPIYVVVTADDPAAFVLTAAQVPLVCGDRFVAGAEQCDDGNDFAGDGCFACELEP
jgi:cysteine-rich repeat protein